MVEVPDTIPGVTADAHERRRDFFLSELEVLAWIGPADAAMISEQHGIRSEDETVRRLQAAVGLSLVHLEGDGRYALTDGGYTALREAIDGES
jgi:hypothetical protein